MTREEIKHITDLCFTTPIKIRRNGESRAYNYDECAAAKKYVMDLLEQEPSGDCISREDAIFTIKNLYPDMPIMDVMSARKKWQEKYSQYIECEKEIERLPSKNV